MTAAQLIAKFDLPAHVTKYLPSWRGAELTQENKVVLLDLIYNGLLDDYNFTPYPKTAEQIKNWEMREAVLKFQEEERA